MVKTVGGTLGGVQGAVKPVGGIVGGVQKGVADLSPLGLLDTFQNRMTNLFGLGGDDDEPKEAKKEPKPKKKGGAVVDAEANVA